MEQDYKYAKWLNNELTDAEIAELKANSELDILEKIKQYSGQLTVKDFDQQAMLTQILNTPKSNVKVIPLYQHWIFKVACTLLLFLGIGYFINVNSTEVILAQNGETENFVLPDNSEVVLNSGSEIHYKTWNWNNNRNLDLKGEAYFKVAKGKTFEVNTTLGKVTVLGTQFKVKARNNRFDVICYEGRVKVANKTENYIITKGQSVSFENNQKIEINSIIGNQPEWLENETRFESESLTNIIQELERQYNVKISIKNTQSTQLFTGKIPNNNLDIALQIISTSFHLQPTKVNSKQIILKQLDAH